MKKSLVSALLGSLLLTATLPANAYVTFLTADSFSSQSGAQTIDFGTSPGGTAPGADLVYSGAGGGVSYAYTGGALYNTSIIGITARPIGSVGNFWSVGTSPAAQTGPAEVNFSTALSYFGFLWGSADTYNTVSFYDGANLLASFTGSQVFGSASGSQAVASYFNFQTGAGEKLTRVAFASSQNAFETDNHAYIAAVPEPETYAMMLAGLGLMGLVARRRKQQLTA